MNNSWELGNQILNYLRLEMSDLGDFEFIKTTTN